MTRARFSEEQIMIKKANSEVGFRMDGHARLLARSPLIRRSRLGGVPAWKCARGSVSLDRFER